MNQQDCRVQTAYKGLTQNQVLGLVWWRSLRKKAVVLHEGLPVLLKGRIVSTLFTLLSLFDLCYLKADLSNNLYHHYQRAKSWFSFIFIDPMLVGRGMFRRVRQRRVLSKSVRRMVSLSTNESGPAEAPYQAPAYLYLFALFAMGYYVGIRISLLVVLIHSMLKRFRVYSRIKESWKKYRNRRAQHGPTMREKIYYYVDYWLSTHP